MIDDPDQSRKRIDQSLFVDNPHSLAYTKSELTERILEADPAILSLVDRVRKTGLRVLGLGEMHRIKVEGVSEGDSTEFQLTLLKRLVESGQRVGTIAIERDLGFQPYIDAFLRREGNLPKEFLYPDQNGFMQGEYFLELLEYARDHGINVVCVDYYPHEYEMLKAEGKIPENHHPSFLDSRDEYMHNRVKDIFNSDPDAIILFLVGSMHLNNIEENHSYRLQYVLPKGTYMSIQVQNCPELKGNEPRILYADDDKTFASTAINTLSSPSTKEGIIYRDFNATVFTPPPNKFFVRNLKDLFSPIP